MRTERDVRENPVAGDVAECRPQGKQSRIYVDGRHDCGLVFARQDILTFVFYDLAQWGKLMEDAAIIHIAQPGGER